MNDVVLFHHNICQFFASFGECQTKMRIVAKCDAMCRSQSELWTVNDAMWMWQMSSENSWKQTITYYVHRFVSRKWWWTKKEIWKLNKCVSLFKWNVIMSY